MKTFSVETLGCRVNQYEGEQIAALLRSRGMVPADAGTADLRVVNTCSVTVQAASKSRQVTRGAHQGYQRADLPAATTFRAGCRSIDSRPCGRHLSNPSFGGNVGRPPRA